MRPPTLFTTGLQFVYKYTSAVSSRSRMIKVGLSLGHVPTLCGCGAVDWSGMVYGWVDVDIWVVGVAWWAVRVHENSTDHYNEGLSDSRFCRWVDKLSHPAVYMGKPRVRGGQNTSTEHRRVGMDV